MKKWRLSETQIFNALRTGKAERASFGGSFSAVKKYHGFEVGVNYDRKKDSRYVIVSCWKKQRR